MNRIEKIATEITTSPDAATHAAIWVFYLESGGFWPTLTEIGASRARLGLPTVTRQAIHPVLRRLAANKAVLMRKDARGRTRGVGWCDPLPWKAKDISAIQKAVLEIRAPATEEIA